MTAKERDREVGNGILAYQAFTDGPLGELCQTGLSLEHSDMQTWLRRGCIFMNCQFGRWDENGPLELGSGLVVDETDTETKCGTYSTLCPILGGLVGICLSFW